ncbi:MAG: TatD family hydrolase [Clostridia bacterium]|nr:TatD family hydrolase [Clostridia bacterium]MDQ7791838.1 TatD family hydrolase [Clostridia bacterium]
MLIDTHAHLDHERFDGERETVIARAEAAGVGLIICVGSDLESSRKSVTLAQANPAIYAAVGVHPHEAAAAPPHYLDEVRRLLGEPRVVALGEIGLDYHYDFSPRPVQRQVFEAQLKLARELDCSVVIHSRKADDDTYRMLTESGVTRVVMHCYSGDWRLAERYLELGFFISLSGVVTFPKSTETREVATRLPLDRLMLETDAPYLAPVPRRGRRNEPAYVYHTAEAVASIRGVSLDEIAQQTTANAREFFRL